MHDLPPSTPSPPGSGPWHRELTRYHWFVLLVAALGWLFDTMDQQLFNLARAPAMTELLATEEGAPVDEKLVRRWGTVATSIFLIGWATGGLTFGVLGDRIGRAKTMMLTILLYSLFTGLSAFSWTIYDFAFFRFLTGLGVGGEFAVGVSLVAEVMPARARPYALGLLQALSAVGNISAALIGMSLGGLEQSGVIDSAWRAMFLVGALPALLALLIRRRLKEPERWQHAAAETSSARLGSYRELFGNAFLRRRAIVGMLLAASGIIGLWGIGFFSPELTRSVLRSTFEARGLTGAELKGTLTFWSSMTLLMQNVGAFFGIYAFTYLAQGMGRRPAFAIAFLAAMVTTASTFWFLNDLTQIFWMVPLMGFCQLSMFGGYAIYFPELFPTYIRSTGTSFCYNVARYVAAVGPPILAQLESVAYAGYQSPMSLRLAGVTMCGVFLIGVLVLPFAPETKDQPLPE